MRFSITILGWELLALELGPTVAAEDEAPVDGGYLTSTPVGFTAAYEIPDQAGPYREGWE